MISRRIFRVFTSGILMAGVVSIATSLAQQRGAVPPGARQAANPPRVSPRSDTPTLPRPPAGMQALPLDLFSSKNFYKDKTLWSDKRYFRCNTPRQITDIWTSHRIGDNPPASAPGANGTPP